MLVGGAGMKQDEKGKLPFYGFNMFGIPEGIKKFY